MTLPHRFAMQNSAVFAPPRTAKLVGGLLVGVALLLAGCTGAEEKFTVPRWIAPTAPGTHNLPPSGLAPRENGVVVWSGERLVVWGGRQPGGDRRLVDALVDGATFDPAAGRWQKMARMPFDTPLVDPIGARIGKDVLVFGMLCDRPTPPPSWGVNHCSGGPAAAIYETARNRWRKVAAPPRQMLQGSPIEGADIAGIAPVLPANPPYGTVMRYHRVTNRWEDLPLPEVIPEQDTNVAASVCTTADGARTDLVVGTRRQEPWSVVHDDLRRWQLATEAAGWSGPTRLGGLTSLDGTTFDIDIGCRDGGADILAVSTSVDHVNKTVHWVLDSAANATQSPPVPIAKSWPDMEHWGPYLAVRASDGYSRGAEAAALTADNQWVQVPTSLQPPWPALGYTWPGRDRPLVWAGDRGYTATQVWLPPRELLSS